MKMITKLMKSKILFAGIIFLSFAFKSVAQNAAIVGPTFNCQGTPLTLTININGLQAPYAYLWTNGATTATVTINNNSIMRVAVTGTNAQGNLQTVLSPFRLFLFLPGPIAGISANGPINFCTGGSVDLIATGGNFFSSYLWSTGETTQTITVTTAGTYSVTITAGLSGCSATSAPVTVTVANLTPTITASGPIQICQGQSVDLTANGGSGSATYLWTSGETTQTITVTTSGTYNVTISEPGGCSGTATAVDVEVFDGSYEPKFTPDGPITFCKPGSVTLTADPGFSSYLWSTGETTQAITVVLDGSQAGAVLDTLSVSLTVDVNGTCSFTSGAVVIRSVREPNLISAYCPNFNLALSTDSIKSGLVLSYLGNDPDYEFEFVETTTQATTTATAVQTRWLKLSDVTPALQVGKFYNVRVRPIVDGLPYCYGNMCQIGIASMFAPNAGNTRVIFDEDGEAITVRDGLNFGIYPNPSNRSFTANIFTLDENQISVKIFDMSGREISSAQFDASQSQYEFGSDLKAGIYFVQFSQGENLNQMTKLIKTN